MAIYYRSSIQNINNWRFWVRKNKCIIKFSKQLFITGRKLHISIVFITQSYFKVPEDVSLNSTDFFIMKISNKIERQELHQIIHQI